MGATPQLCGWVVARPDAPPSCVIVKKSCGGAADALDASGTGSGGGRTGKGGAAAMAPTSGSNLAMLGAMAEAMQRMQQAGESDGGALAARLDAGASDEGEIEEEGEDEEEEDGKDADNVVLVGSDDGGGGAGGGGGDGASDSTHTSAVGAIRVGDGSDGAWVAVDYNHDASSTPAAAQQLDPGINAYALPAHIFFLIASMLVLTAGVLVVIIHGRNGAAHPAERALRGRASRGGGERGAKPRRGGKRGARTGAADAEEMESMIEAE